tara:strand:- start:4962 stop:5525 length:564 start_codon:yes stop_codon:yes gene_type:complete
MPNQKSAKSDLSKDANKYSKGIPVRYESDKEKYSKTKFVQVYRGYDFLENLGTVRQFIQRKYDISWRDLELMLKLFAMKVFSMSDYHATPRYYTHNKFKSALDNGFIQLVSDHNTVVKRLYTLSARNKNIVRKFYAFLSGEEKIPEDSHYNPMAKKNKDYAMDKHRMDLIKRMNQLPVKAHTKRLFE